MRKILVITTSFPFPLYSGDKLRIYNIINHLAKKNKVDLIYTGSKENYKKKIKCINNTFFIRTEKLSDFDIENNDSTVSRSDLEKTI